MVRFGILLDARKHGMVETLMGQRFITAYKVFSEPDTPNPSSQDENAPYCGWEALATLPATIVAFPHEKLIKMTAVGQNLLIIPHYRDRI